MIVIYIAGLKSSKDLNKNKDNKSYEFNLNINKEDSISHRG